MESINIESSLDLIIGPMYSGKTTELIRRLNIYAATMHLKVLYVNAKIDTRSSNEFSTHNPMFLSLGDLKAVKIEKLSDLANPSVYDVIGIDEAQFMPDLEEYVMKFVEEYKIKVIVAGLNGDHMRRPFGQVLDLIPLCDNIQKLSPFCVPCCNQDKIIKKAPFTKRIVSGTDTVVIGGKETYIPVCRECYLSQKSEDKVTNNE